LTSDLLESLTLNSKFLYNGSSIVSGLLLADSLTPLSYCSLFFPSILHLLWSSTCIQASKLCIYKSLLTKRGHSAIDYRCQCKEPDMDFIWSICTLIQWTALSRSSMNVQGNHFGRPFSESFWAKPSIPARTTCVTEETFRRTCILGIEIFFLFSFSIE